MLYNHITTHCLGAGNEALVKQYSALLAPVQEALAKREDAASRPLLNLCSGVDGLEEIRVIAEIIRRRFKHVVVCGAGGSGLSGQVLLNLLLGFSAPKLHFLDTIDPDAVRVLLHHCPPQDTCIITISKSGGTVETLSQFYVFLAHFKHKLGNNIAPHFLVITVPEPSPLRQSAQEHGFHVIDHPRDIGGRFSIFTAVGLLSAAIAGLDIVAIRRGASRVLEKLSHEEAHPARLGAALQFAHMQQGKTMSVMLPYCARLAGFSAWYRQSWAESLGKSGKGTTPICAVGTTDQHSQLQLYLDGPKDKFFTLVFLSRAGRGQKIEAPEMEALDYIQHKTTGDIMAAEQKATLETLVKNGCPVRLITCETLDEETLGALLMHFMLEIMFMAKLLGVNAFDQPAVEEGKVLAREYLLSGRI